MRRVAVLGWTTLALGLFVSPIAVAEPQRAPSPAVTTTTAPPPDREPAPPPTVCRDLNDSAAWSECSMKCEGIDAAYKSVTPVPQACDEMGRAQRVGRHIAGFPPSPPYPDDAFRFFGLGCRLAQPLPGVPPAQPFWGACYDLGTSFLNGEGTPKDEAAARRLYAQAAQLAAPALTYPASFALGELFEAGVGGAKDLGAALEAYRKACTAKYPRACRAALRLQPAARASHPPRGTPPP